MRVVLAQPDAASVGADRELELGCHEDDGQNLVHGPDATGIDLDNVLRKIRVTFRLFYGQKKGLSILRLPPWQKMVHIE